MRRYKKNITIYILVILLLGITLGYAYLNTTLNINGTTNITSANWSIYWDNIVFGSDNVTDITTPATISQGLTEVTFNVNFSEPGDTYEFTVDVVNDGSINAMVSVVSNGVYAANGTTPKTLPDYLEYTVTYSDGMPIAQNHLLESGETETYKVRVHYKEDISSSQLPSTNDNYVFKFSVTYVQADSNAVAVDHSKIVYTINQVNYNILGYNFINLNNQISTDITQYQTASEAMNAFTTLSGSSKLFYLKHKVESDIVVESYVEFVVTPEMAQVNSGMIAGTYALRGGIDESSLIEKPIYEANKEKLKQAFGYTTDSSRCYEASTYFDCSVSGFNSHAISDGYVRASDGSLNCDVTYAGSSACGI